jgi:rhodanese-related sulfurtransferase/CBS domain-containing protein
LAERGAQLEVLPKHNYVDEHLAGARNLPLEQLADRCVDLDPTAPTVVYCYDYQCDLSARGAAILEARGFTDVYDYVASKAAWLAFGRPVEGRTPRSSRAGAIARTVPTCSLGSTLADILGRFGDDGLIVVVDDCDTVLGVVRDEVRHLPATTGVQELVRWDPPTVRPSITASELAESMRKDDRTFVLVTTLNGVLQGIVTRSDLHGSH